MPYGGITGLNGPFPLLFLFHSRLLSFQVFFFIRFLFLEEFFRVSVEVRRTCPHACFRCFFFFNFSARMRLIETHHFSPFHLRKITVGTGNHGKRGMKKSAVCGYREPFSAEGLWAVWGWRRHAIVFYASLKRIRHSMSFFLVSFVFLLCPDACL